MCRGWTREWSGRYAQSRGEHLVWAICAISGDFLSVKTIQACQSISVPPVSFQRTNDLGQSEKTVA